MTFAAFLQLVRVSDAPASLLENDLEFTGCGLADVEIDEQVVRVVATLDAYKPYTLRLHNWRVCGNAFSVQQQLQFMMFETGPPERGLDACAAVVCGNGGFIRGAAREEQE